MWNTGQKAVRQHGTGSSKVLTGTRTMIQEVVPLDIGQYKWAGSSLPTLLERSHPRHKPILKRASYTFLSHKFLVINPFVQSIIQTGGLWVAQDDNVSQTI
jgi:hypothetical protein